MAALEAELVAAKAAKEDLRKLVDAEREQVGCLRCVRVCAPRLRQRSSRGAQAGCVSASAVHVQILCRL